MTDPVALRNARLVARLLDTSFGVPGTRWRFGLDPLIGLIPGVGDFAGVLLSSTILLSAARLGVPVPTLLRMGLNVALEGVLGTVPLLGDLFDAAWKANVRNLHLIEGHLLSPRRAARADRRWLLAVAGGITGALLTLVAALTWAVMSLLVRVAP